MIKTTYVRNDEKNLQVTIVSEVVNVDGILKLNVGWAFRSKHDKFIKKVGREIAIDRMNNNDKDYSYSFEVKELKYIDLILEIIREILVRNSTPKKYVHLLNDEIKFYSWLTSYRKIIANTK